MNELHNSVKTEELWFWGKIIGLESDYFVALGVNYKNHYEFPEKLFYYTPSTTFNFQPLPEISPSHLSDMQASNLAFLTGNPATIIKQYEEEVDPDSAPVDNPPVDQNNNPDVDPENPGEPKEENLDDTVEEQKAPEEKKKNFTELVKLTYLIRNIDNDTNVVPQGAFRLIPIHELRRNDTFRGLKPEELRDLSKFHYFRSITDPEKKKIVESDDAVFKFDFLDSLDNDPVKCSWSIQLDSNKKIVSSYSYVSVT